MKYLFILLSLFIVQQTAAQILIDTTRFYESANAGTVKQITSEEVCAIVFFVSGPQHDWKTSAKRKFLRRDKKTFKNLREGLKKYDINFRIHFEVFNLDQDFEIDSVVEYRQQPLIEDHVKKHSEYKSFNAKKIWMHYSGSEIPFFKEKTYLTYEGGYFLIFYYEGLGLSTASASLLNTNHASAIYDDVASPEYINIFAYNMNWGKRTKYVTVHETLHLFGAWDLYKNPSNWGDTYTGAGHNEEDYEYMLNEIPSSIMRNSNQVTIDELTAWRIGINNNPDPWFLEMAPIGYHKSYWKKKQVNEASENME